MPQATSANPVMDYLRSSQPMRPRYDTDHAAELIERYLQMTTCRPGARMLPSPEQLCVDTDLSRSYVEIGLKILEDLGVVEQRDEVRLYLPREDINPRPWTSWGMFDARRKALLSRALRSYNPRRRTSFKSLAGCEINHHLTLELELTGLLPNEPGAPCLVHMLSEQCATDPVFCSVFDPLSLEAEEMLAALRHDLLLRLSGKNISPAAAVEILVSYYNEVERLYFVENRDYVPSRK